MSLVGQTQQTHGDVALEKMDGVLEWMYKAFTILAELVLVIGIGYAGYKLSQHGNTNPQIDAAWLVSQFIALDLSAPGLFIMSRESREQGDNSQAAWATTIAIALIVLSSLSMTEGAIQTYFPLVHGWGLDALSFFLLVARCVAAVLYSVFKRLHKAQGRTQLVLVSTLQGQIEVQHREMEHMRQSHSQELQATIIRMEQEAQQKVQSAILQIETEIHKKLEAPKQKHEPLTVESEPAVNTDKVQAVKVQRGPLEPLRELSVVEVNELPQVNIREVIFRYLAEQREQGEFPSLNEIMIACQCSKNTAIKYKREFAESE